MLLSKGVFTRSKPPLQFVNVLMQIIIKVVRNVFFRNVACINKVLLGSRMGISQNIYDKKVSFICHKPVKCPVKYYVKQTLDLPHKYIILITLLNKKLINIYHDPLLAL